MNWKGLFGGIVILIFLGVGGFIYRNAVEHPNKPIACPLDARVCPDGTALGRTGPSCTFPECAPPNVSVASVGISFAVPAGYVPDEGAASADPTMVGAFVTSLDEVPSGTIIIRDYQVASSSTALETIKATAIGATSGEPVPATAYTSETIGSRSFTIVQIDRFEAIIQTAYYWKRGNDVLRFDAIDRNVSDWTNPDLNVQELPAHKALRAMLETLQGHS